MGGHTTIPVSVYALFGPCSTLTYVMPHLANITRLFGQRLCAPPTHLVQDFIKNLQTLYHKSHAIHSVGLAVVIYDASVRYFIPTFVPRRKMPSRGSSTNRR